MSKIPVSVCIIAKNEEKNIERCLKSISQYGFEIIVTDTGSTDRTKEIASRYADKVLDFKWINDFSAARNYCTKYASNDWILSLDCDEEVNNIDLFELKLLMRSYPKQIGMMILNEVIIKETGERSFVTAEALKFYNKKYFQFREPVHEQICFIDNRKRGETLPVFKLPMDVTHYGYAVSNEEFRKKAKRDLDILKISLESKPDDPYINYQIGQSLFIMDEYDAAISHYKKALLNLDSYEYAFADDLVCSFAKLYLYIGHAQKAVNVLKEYYTYFIKAKYLYLYAEALKRNGECQEAINMYIKASEMNDVETLGANLADCYENIINLSRKLGNESLAELYLNKYHASVKEIDKVLNNEGNNISICVISNNNEDTIEDCLGRITNQGFQIIVIDICSRDKTKEIAAKYADKIVDYTLADECESIRSFCAKQAETDWVLILYADEYISSLDVKGIEFLTKKYPLYVGYIQISTMYKDTENKDSIIRMYNKEYYTFDEYEKIKRIDILNDKEEIKWFIVPVNVTRYQYKTEYQHSLKIINALISTNHLSIGLYLKAGYICTCMKEFEQAISYIEEGLEIDEDTNKIVVQKMIILLAKCNVFLGRLSEALEVMQKYQNDISSPEYIYAYANICIDNKMYTKALLLFIKITTMDDGEALGDDLIHTYEKIIAIYQAMGFSDMSKSFEDKYIQLIEQKK